MGSETVSIFDLLNNETDASGFGEFTVVSDDSIMLNGINPSYGIDKIVLNSLANEVV